MNSVHKLTGPKKKKKKWGTAGFYCPVIWHYTEYWGYRRKISGGESSAESLLLLLILVFLSSAFWHSNQPKLLVTSKGCHVVVTVHCVKRVARQAEENVRKYAERRSGNGWCQEMVDVKKCVLWAQYIYHLILLTPNLSMRPDINPSLSLSHCHSLFCQGLC